MPAAAAAGARGEERIDVVLEALAGRQSRLTPDDLVSYAKTRADMGAGPYTINMDISKLGTVMRLVSAALHIELPDVVGKARPLLNHLKLIGGGGKRERRPTEDELVRICHQLETKRGKVYADAVRFAVLTAMRRGETFSGLPPFAMEDAACTASMGPVSDRQEMLVPADLAIVRMRRYLLEAARAQMVIQSRAAGLEAPIDTVWIELREMEAFAASCTRGVALGFQGKLCIHPDQIPVANAAFSPAEAEVARARRIMALYEDSGIARERVLIKIAATWEGIRAAELLERAGIQCNLTLLFSFAQASACADAGTFLISPFVGRIYDWYKKAEGRDFSGAEDPGVQSVSRIYRYYKAHGYKTVVMGASFRNLGQIEALAGCDRLTISPDLLQQLATDSGLLERQLQANGASEARQTLNESQFRWKLNEDAMATEKLAEGIRLFARDQEKLEALLEAKR